MMFWQWFQENGDRVFAFISLLSVALQGVDDLSAQASKTILIAGIIATVGHQAFFPNQPGPTAPKVVP
jgi:hypothetical protein